MLVFPVVHVDDTAVALVQACVALELGAEGVYLISHDGSTSDLFAVLEAVSAEVPAAFGGVNLLG